MNEALTADLEQLVLNFNNGFREWEKTYNHGANFSFIYLEDTGKKVMRIKDIAPLEIITSDNPKIKDASLILKSALESMEDGQS